MTTDKLKLLRFIRSSAHLVRGLPPLRLDNVLFFFSVHRIKITFVLHDGKRLETQAKVGDSLLDVVVNNDLNIEGYGACEGTLTCSTCHVVLKPEDYDR